MKYFKPPPGHIWSIVMDIYSWDYTCIKCKQKFIRKIGQDNYISIKNDHTIISCKLMQNRLNMDEALS